MILRRLVENLKQQHWTAIGIELASLMRARLRECRLDDSQRADFASGVYLLGRLEPLTLTRGTIGELRSTAKLLDAELHKDPT